MALGVLGTLLAESYDARHEAAAAIEDLIETEQLIGTAITAELGREVPADPTSDEQARGLERLCGSARSVEARGSVRVLLQTAHGLVDCERRSLGVPSLERALEAGERSAFLTREEAMRLGLLERTAVASVLHPPAATGVSAVAVVGSAATERDRSRHQQARTIISVSAVSAMILGFGLVALRRQGQKLALEKQVELARVREERDLELAKANRMAALAALASGFAHEIGTPLGIIAGRVEQLRSPTTTATPERRSELLTQVALQVDRIGKLIRSLLSFARGDAPRLVEARARDLAESALRLVSHRFAAAEVELRLVHAGDPGNARLMCDPALFEQVLVNLLSNALEASAQGQAVTLAIEERPADLSFIVKDEGSGVSEAALERALEPFFTTKAGRGGSGLGLTIAREIVAHHRGELVIRKRSDAVTSGTEVVVRVPHLAEVLK